ncbi:MAG TPA: hypothetical protein VHA09_02135 [Nitrososphaera sp.]|nr:hypothetical protein [Nitrososphaera sp.]
MADKLPVTIIIIIIIAATGVISITVIVALASDVLQQSSSSLPKSQTLLPSDTQRNGIDEVGFYSAANNGGSSLIVDQKGDAKADKQYETRIVPAVMSYHDILWADVQKSNTGNGDHASLLLTIGLAGDPNSNEKYETAYMWHIITSTCVYTVILPNFAPDSSFAAKGWYYAVYNNTNERYLVPMTRISFEMPKDRVEIPLAVPLVGDAESFHYWVSVHVRVDSKNISKPPDYLVDYAP